ncbi:MAG: hypothetical protein EAZ32_15215 [Cytophagia bacterium]|jgi:hypothetical protein|nr:MAG: hypothetical protein EAZ38_16155 [Cytophagales bacterium]TAG37506.1 MAG: hypothetical protein EAZ32_15215 [Cytophagia bacterium]TAG78574.1 MAG: hypothetical protein EAZ22_13300 [Cytophagales bacterium]
MIETNYRQNYNQRVFCIALFIMVTFLRSLTFGQSNSSVGTKQSNLKNDITLEQEAQYYKQKQQELLKRLLSIEQTKDILRNCAVKYAQYNSKDTLEIVKLWLKEFKDVTKFSDNRMVVIEQDIRKRATSRYGLGHSVLNTLDMYCFDILLLNMTAEEYGRYIKDVHMLNRWLSSRASDKLYIHYKSGLKLTDEKASEAFKKIMTK